jgi:O-methyltransferase
MISNKLLFVRLFIFLCLSNNFFSQHIRVGRNKEKSSFFALKHSFTETFRPSSTYHPSLIGLGYEIFLPSVFFANDPVVCTKKLISSPHIWINSLIKTYKYLDSATITDLKLPDLRVRATEAYLEMLIGLLTGISYGNAEKSVIYDRVLSLNLTRRSENGPDMTYLGLTLVNKKRLWNIYDLLTQIASNNVSGDIIETGIWRGGASIFTKAVMEVLSNSLNHHQHSPSRLLYVCDSFAGLPEGNSSLHEGDIGWNKLTYLSVSEKMVAHSFYEYSVLDETVVFVKGFFNVTMPILAEKVLTQSISLLRMDGDIYESTADVLYSLYEKVTIGGFIIIDDWDGFPAKDACLDFFKIHQMNPTIIPVDNVSIYWKKTEQILVEKWRMISKHFKPIS